MLTSTATTMLRAGAGRSAATLQPALFRTAACPYSAGLTISPFSVATTAPASQKQQQPRRPLSTRPTNPSTTTTSSPSLIITYRAQPPRRNASSARHHPHPTTEPTPTPDAAADASAAEVAAKAAAAAHPEQVTLDWNTFFALRKARRRWQSGFSVVAAFASGTTGGMVLSSGLGDSLVAMIPLDPLISLGLITMSAAALGWLAGPSIGSVVFNARKGKYKGPMAIKESEFFARIKKHRVDPTASSVRNPVPDFYGEKISSVAGYRQWLRDQRAFNRKKIGKA
ncbi:mitochondrial import protein Pam17-domain-containing protein [Staphylotrichum tortipilum]|uniref:Presequence translocated-associated motor subunit PAM17 n=1 Tax=Staphylotrichum tortipilum TaxID=2831512 RepID=A0AAN6MPL4_9PEZI|nr:mitochondrial import protein Pam17-domain-containing protein [Staphylotrichum longicolle]